VIKQVRVLGAGVFAGLLFTTAAMAQGAPNGNMANGKKLFETIGCFECHGYAGQGGGAGPKLISPPAWEAFILQVRTPRNVMPPFTAKVLSDQQIADIYAYVQTFPKPPDPKTILLLQN
jgi:ubiquinol-cytochrome c reductase cytochrome c subunit